MWRKGDISALLVGTQTGAATLSNSRKVPTKLKIELPYDPAIALLGIYPKDTKMLIQRGTCTPMFIAGLLIIAKVWKGPLADKWIKKVWYIYYTAIKKNETLPFTTTWMELEYIC